MSQLSWSVKETELFETLGVMCSVVILCISHWGWKGPLGIKSNPCKAGSLCVYIHFLFWL